MGIVSYVLIALAVPIFFFLLTWALVTAYRLLFPEAPRPVEEDPVRVRQRATARGEHVPVGAREIREDQRHFRSAHPQTDYAYFYGTSDGFPENWSKDLWRRRN